MISERGKSSRRKNANNNYYRNTELNFSVDGFEEEYHIVVPKADDSQYFATEIIKFVKNKQHAVTRERGFED
jgi:hypothetical protein